jgi:hypothetical protein
MERDRPRVGDEVVVVVGDQEVIAKVSRMTPHGMEVTFDLELPASALGAPMGHATWRSGREALFPLAGADVMARVSVLVDPGAPAPEQRAYVRLERRLAVDVAMPEGDRQLATGSTQDLSTDGAKLRLNRGLKKGEHVALTIHLDDGPLGTRAEVLRHRTLKDGSHEVAVRFDLAPGDAKSRLVRYVFARMRAATKKLT